MNAKYVQPTSVESVSVGPKSDHTKVGIAQADVRKFTMVADTTKQHTSAKKNERGSSTLPTKAVPKGSILTIAAELPENMRVPYALGLAALMTALVHAMLESTSDYMLSARSMLNPMSMEFNTWIGIYLFKQFAIVLVWDNVRLVVGLLAHVR